MRPIFVGNFGCDTRQSDLERIFSQYGRIEPVDMKTGTWAFIGILEVWQNPSSGREAFLLICCLQISYAFAYFEDERDAEDAIHALDNVPFGYDKCRLSVEWARGERGRALDGSKGGNRRPPKTLFVINFDPLRTRTRDLERHSEPYGKVLSVRIRWNFAFVQFETQEDATKALECTNMSKLLDRVISVEYALRDDNDRDDQYGSPGRSYGRSSSQRSPSPRYCRSRPSPACGRPRSPIYDRYDGPAYERHRSPVCNRYRSRSPIRR